MVKRPLSVRSIYGGGEVKNALRKGPVRKKPVIVFIE